MALIVPVLSHAADHTSDTLAQVRKAVAAKKAILVDVREEREWKRGHLAAAVLLPLSELRGNVDPQQVAAKLPQGAVIYTHCASGLRCLTAGDILQKLGYEVRCLKPGYTDLLKAGFEPAQDSDQ
jgi:rhodanese-related sulfurtransferase